MSDKFGINVKRYCREHEQNMRAEPPTPGLLDRHMEMLRRLQHERLIHLIVLAMVVIVELFTVDLTVLHPETNPLAAVVMLALAVLLAFYFRHYFFLENTVQRWYILADEARRALGETQNDVNVDVTPADDKAAGPAVSAEVASAVGEIQRTLMNGARENARPRIGA